MTSQQRLTLSIARIVRSILSRTAKHGGRFMRFGVVGAAGVVINTALLYLGATFIRLPAVLAAGLATELTILSNFALNDRWTFRDVRAHQSKLRRLAAYNGIALGGMFISLAVFVVLMHLLRMNYLLANLAGIVVATFWNYIVNARVTWRATTTKLMSEVSDEFSLDSVAESGNTALNI